MAVHIGINGFGRIGRCVLRAWLESGRKDVAITKINSRSPVETAAHLLQYDTTHGALSQSVSVKGGSLNVDNQAVPYTQNTDITAVAWDDCDVVLECTGVFNTRAEAANHLKNGAKRVIISAPAKDADATIAYGVNHPAKLDDSQQVISAASCTTNCLAPVAKTLHDNFGIAAGWMSTVHAYTADQRLLDESHPDLRRARAAAGSIIPTKTGAASSIGLVIPELQGKLDGIALRVPVPNVSLVDLTCQLENTPDADTINAAFDKAAAAMPPNVLSVNRSPLVSSDFNHAPYSAIIDATQTRAHGNLAKVLAWYDNEWGFANRMLDLAALHS